MTIAGYATTEGTARYKERFRATAAANHFAYEQHLWLSSIGLGTYLGPPDEATDRSYVESITRAVELGANVIDTAANYRFQRSERAIGAALQKLTDRDDGGFGREEILLCSKGGYLPFDGAPPRGQEGVRRYVEETFVGPGIADFTDIVAGSHCMTPRYLAHQLEQSRRNMNVETIDVYYVHNPETQLQVVGRAEFEARLRTAFEALERAVSENKIRAYGLATWNGFRVAANTRGYHSLERIVELAHEAGGDAHHFRFVQLPFNLGMPEALTETNQTFQGAEVSLLEAARALGVTVMASASLLQGRAARDLPEHIREPLGSLASDALTALQFTRSTPGITTALVGMSRPEHVAENLRLARVEPTSMDDYERLFAGGDE
jgi:aryl-alcohol dehydrogenase-like predicted oxidoreductase